MTTRAFSRSMAAVALTGALALSLAACSAETTNTTEPTA